MDAETAYVFRHALLRDAAYQLQLPGVRARLHALAAAILDEIASKLAADLRGAVCEELVSHASQAEVVLPDDMATHMPRHLLDAGLHCMRGYRTDEARHWLEMAQAHPAASSEIVVESRLWLAQCMSGSAPDRARDFLLSCEPRLVDARNPILEGRCYLGLAIMSEGRAGLEETDALYLRALQALRPRGSSPELANALACHAVWRFDQGCLEEADGLFDEAIEIARQSNNGNALGRVLGLKGSTLYRRGRLREVVEVAQQALSAAGDEAIIQAECQLRAANASSDQGLVGQADAYFAQAIERFERTGSRVRLAGCRGDFARHLQNSGRWAQAEAEYTVIEEIAREGGYQSVLAGVEQNRASLDYDRGRWAAALERYQRAERVYQQFGNARMSALCRGGAAMARDAMGQEAREELAAVCLELQRLRDGALQSIFEQALGDAHMERGELVQAVLHSEKTLALCIAANVEGGIIRAKASLAMCKAAGGRLTEAQTILNDAMAMAELSELPLVRTDLHLDLAKLALLGADAAVAREHLDASAREAQTSDRHDATWRWHSLKLRQSIASGERREHVLNAALAACRRLLHVSGQSSDTRAGREMARLERLVEAATANVEAAMATLSTGFLPEERPQTML